MLSTLMLGQPLAVHVPVNCTDPGIEREPAPLADIVSSSTFAVCPTASPVKVKKGAEALSIRVVFAAPAPTVPAPVFGVPVPVMVMPTFVMVIPEVHVHVPAGMVMVSPFVAV